MMVETISAEESEQISYETTCLVLAGWKRVSLWSIPDYTAVKRDDRCHNHWGNEVWIKKGKSQEIWFGKSVSWFSREEAFAEEDK